MVVSKVLAVVRRMTSDQKGVTALEYGLVGALVVVVCAGVIGTMGQRVLAYFTAVGAV